MILRKGAPYYYPFFLRACLALLTTSAAVDLSHVSPSNFFSFTLAHAAKPSTAASSHGPTPLGIVAAAATANFVGGTVFSDVAVHSSLLRGEEATFSRRHFAAVILRSLKAAITAAAAVRPLTSLPLFAVAVSPEERRTDEIKPPTSGETLLAKFVQQISSVEIPTFSAALSSGVDRVASAIFLHFFPDAQLPYGTLPSGAYFSLHKTAPQIRESTPVGRAEGRTADRTTEGVFAVGREVAAGAKAQNVKRQVSAPMPTTASSTAARAASVVPPRPVPPAYCSTSNNDRCSSIIPGGAGQNVFTSPSLDNGFSSQTASNDSSSTFSSWESLTFVPSSSSSPRSAAQTHRVCSSAARQQDTCTSSTAPVPGKRFSSIGRTGETFTGLFSSPLEAPGAATREDSNASLSAAAAAGVISAAGDETSQAQLLAAGGAATEEGVHLSSPLLSSAATAGANEEESGSRLLPSASAAASGQQHSGLLLPEGQGLPYEDVELLGNLYERPRNAHAFSSVELSDVQGFLSSVDFLDPLLLVLLGFHLLLVAAVLCCRRMHAAQLLLLCSVSLLLLCSKQLLLLCSLVEQRLRTDDSLASAIAAFASSTPPSSPSSSSSSSLSAATPQFYCSPSAAARATLFLLLFWWLPLFTTLLLLVGTLLQELVASLRLLATRKAKAARRRPRSVEETAAAATSTRCAVSTLVRDTSPTTEVVQRQG